MLPTLNFRLIPADTTPEAFWVLLDVYRRMSPERRFELACAMSNSLRELAACGVRHRHPDYTEDQVRLAVARLMLGDKLFHEAFPGMDVAV